MNNDRLTTIIGGLLSAITAVQPMIAAIDGEFGYKDALQIVAAALIAGLGYYINRVDKPKN